MKPPTRPLVIIIRNKIFILNGHGLDCHESEERKNPGNDGGDNKVVIIYSRGSESVEKTDFN